LTPFAAAGAVQVPIGVVAGTSPGGTFILGTSNSAGSTTGLWAPIGGRALQVSNTSTTTGATALGLTVAAGHAPLTISSGAARRRT